VYADFEGGLPASRPLTVVGDIKDMVNFSGCPLPTRYLIGPFSFISTEQKEVLEVLHVH